MSHYDALICADCEWSGDIHELIPMEGEDFGNERCPECGSLDVGEQHSQDTPFIDLDTDEVYYETERLCEEMGYSLTWTQQQGGCA